MKHLHALVILMMITQCIQYNKTWKHYVLQNAIYDAKFKPNGIFNS